MWSAAGQERKIWQLIGYKRPQERREVYDVRLHSTRLMRIAVLSFHHPGIAQESGAMRLWHRFIGFAGSSPLVARL